MILEMSETSGGRPEETARGNWDDGSETTETTSKIGGSAWA